MSDNRTVGGCLSGGRGGETKSPQERYDVIFLRHFYRAWITKMGIIAPCLKNTMNAAAPQTGAPAADQSV